MIMPHAGQVLANPMSGETITILRTAADTGGAAVELGFAVTPGGAPAAPHVHPIQTETFAVHEGRCRVVIDGDERVLGPGEAAVVPPGAAHTWSALEELQMTVTLEPGLRSDVFFEELVAIVRAGRVDGKGLPTPLHMAVLADDHRPLVYLTGAPVWVQKAAFRALAKLGRALGKTAAAAERDLARAEARRAAPARALA